MSPIDPATDAASSAAEARDDAVRAAVPAVIRERAARYPGAMKLLRAWYAACRDNETPVPSPEVAAVLEKIARLCCGDTDMAGCWRDVEGAAWLALHPEED